MISADIYFAAGNPTLEAPLIEPQIWMQKASGNQAGAKANYMPRSPAICRELRSLPSSVGLAVECLDGSFAFYRIRGSLLERIQDLERSWTEVPAEDILQHLVLQTPVAVWLESRMVLKPADWVKPYFHTE
jgi:hypothetical protein